MNSSDLDIIKRLKQKLIESQIPVMEVIVFGSRARGEAGPDSDLDVLILVEWSDFEQERFISRCAWEIGFDSDVFIQPVVMTYQQVKQGPEKSSLFIRAIEEEGVHV